MKNNAAYRHFTTKEIKPSGWLKRQLEIQAQGLSGNLDKVWPDVRDSAWIGGDREGWERVPYWLDGFIPLAYLLDDDDLKARAKKYIDAIISRQEPDGWICPCAVSARGRYDVWAVFLICKVLVVYYECSGDSRVEKTVSGVLSNLHRHLFNHTLFNWGQSRWFEALIPIYWLYDRTGETWLEELAVMMSAQGLDYRRLFAYWQSRAPKAEWNYQTHIVNLMMALKSEALFSRISGDDPDEFARQMLDILNRHHGTAVGHISGDECLAGREPIHGAELCSIAEALYSYEKLFEISGNPSWADHAEITAFNSLPAAISEDMRTHQYVQMINQIACCRQNDPAVFFTNSNEANVFGLEPHFGCCTANFNQAWPKLALSTYVYNDDSIVSSVLVPSELECSVHGAGVHISLETDYPFKGTLKYTVTTDKPVAFDFAVRIPGFAKSAVVAGKSAKPGELFTMSENWQGSREINVKFEFAAVLKACPEDTFCLQRGPLFYAVPVKAKKEMREYVRDGVERKYPYCDYDLYSDSPWNYAFCSEEFAVTENSVAEHPFSRTAPPITMETKMAQINWDTMASQPNVCSPYPNERKSLLFERVTLVPYGCTYLRMTQLPYVPLRS